jgi:hypothetical protein
MLITLKFRQLRYALDLEKSKKIGDFFQKSKSLLKLCQNDGACIDKIFGYLVLQLKILIIYIILCI